MARNILLRSSEAKTHTILDWPGYPWQMFEAEMFWGLSFGLPAEFLRGLTGTNSLSVDQQNEPNRCADKLTNKINSADMLPIKVKGDHLLAIKLTNSDVIVNQLKYIWGMNGKFVLSLLLTREIQSCVLN